MVSMTTLFAVFAVVMLALSGFLLFKRRYQAATCTGLIALMLTRFSSVYLEKSLLTAGETGGLAAQPGAVLLYALMMLTATALIILSVVLKIRDHAG